MVNHSRLSRHQSHCAIRHKGFLESLPAAASSVPCASCGLVPLRLWPRHKSTRFKCALQAVISAANASHAEDITHNQSESLCESREDGKKIQLSNRIFKLDEALSEVHCISLLPDFDWRGFFLQDRRWLADQRRWQLVHVLRLWLWYLCQLRQPEDGGGCNCSCNPGPCRHPWYLCNGWKRECFHPCCDPRDDDARKTCWWQSSCAQLQHQLPVQ